MEREKEEEKEEGRAVCTADMMNQISGRHDHDHHKAHSRDSVRFTTRQTETHLHRRHAHSHDGAPDKSLHTVNSPALSAAESDGDYVNTEAAVIAPCVAPVLEVRHILDS